MLPLSPQRPSRRQLLSGITGSLLIGSAGGVALTPAIVTRTARASPQLAQVGIGFGDAIGPGVEIETIAYPNTVVSEVRTSFKRRLIAYSIERQSTIIGIDYDTRQEVFRIRRRNHEISGGTFDFILGGTHLLSSSNEWNQETFRSGSMADVIEVASGKIVSKIALPSNFDQARFFSSSLDAHEDGETAISRVRVTQPHSETGQRMTQFKVAIVNVRLGKFISFLEPPGFGPLFGNHSAWHPSAGLAASHMADSRIGEMSPINIHDPLSGSLVKALNGNRPVVSALAWNKSGKRLASAGYSVSTAPRSMWSPMPMIQEEQPIFIWDVDSATVVAKLAGDLYSAFRMQYSHDDKNILIVHLKRSMTPGQRVSVLNLDTGRSRMLIETGRWDGFGITDSCWGLKPREILFADRKSLKLLRYG